MANKRMFSVDVTETDAFYSLPAKAQAVYFHLGMRADDDGFVASPKRSCGASEKVLNCLYDAGYIIRFQSGVIVLTDWKVNNTLKADRYQKTVHQEEFSTLKESASKRYISLDSGTASEPDRSRTGTLLGTTRSQNASRPGTTLVPQDRIEKESVAESSRERTAAASLPMVETDKETEPYPTAPAFHGAASHGSHRNCHHAIRKNALAAADSVAAPEHSEPVEDSKTALEPERTTAGSGQPSPTRTDAALGQLVRHFQQAVGEFPRSALDRLQRWREVFPAEVLCRAFDEAAENGHRSWRYVDGILSSWQADGVRTLGDVDARREARKKPEPQETQWEVLT